MRKILPVCLLLVLMTILLCGCAQSFTFTYYLDKSGAVHKDYRFEYDADADDAEIVLAEAERVISKAIVKNNWSNYAKVDTSKAGVVELHVTYPSLTDYYIALGYTGNEKNDILDHENQGILTSYTSVSEDYYSDAFVRDARELMGEGYETVPFSGCDFYYVYGTKYRTTTSNADSVEEKDGIYYHTWKLQPDTAQDIVVTQYGLNGYLLYIVIISVFVLSLAIITAIIIYNNKRNKAVFRSATAEPSVPAEEKTTDEEGE